mgnify:CR=1 FL=1
MRLGRAFRKTGRAILRAQREASKLNEGLDDILGPNRTRPSDGFSSDRTRKRASMGPGRKTRMRSKLRDTSSGTDKDFDLSFGSSSKKSKKDNDDEDRRFF